MSRIHIKQNHSLGQEKIRERVEGIARSLKKEYKINYGWKGNRLLFKRSGASGHLDLGEGYIELTISLGLVLRPMKGRIEQTIRQEMAAYTSEQGSTPLA